MTLVNMGVVSELETTSMLNFFENAKEYHTLQKQSALFAYRVQLVKYSFLGHSWYAVTFPVPMIYILIFSLK